jgi:chitinase
MAQLAQSQGIKYFTLAFMLGNGCQAEWNGDTTFDQSALGTYINNLRSVGGDVIVSFGGASGTYLEDACSSVSSLAAQFQAVLDRYNVTYIDFDVENDLGNSAAQTRRSQAIAQVQAAARSAGKTLKVSFTLGVDTSGLPSDQINVLQSAISNGVDISLVNIMTMDYGGPVSQMGNAAIQAANSTFSQLKTLFPAKSDAQIWAMLGITPMIGQNDNAGEIFSLSNAQQVMTFAQQNNIGLLAFWALERDFQCTQSSSGASDTCSSVTQAAYAFSNIFKAITH